MRRRRISRGWHGRALALSTIAVVGASLVSCDVAREPPPRIPIVGAILPLSGPDAKAGAEVLRGMELAAAAPESEAGPPIVLAPVDGEGRPGVSILRRLELDEEPGVILAVGGWFAATGRALAASTPKNGLPFLALSPLAAPREHRPGPGLLRLHRLEALGRAAAAFCRQDLGVMRAAVIGLSGSEVSTVLADAFADAFVEAGGDVTWSATFATEATVDGPRTLIYVDRKSGEGEGPPEAVWIAGPAALAAEIMGLDDRVASVPRLFAARGGGRSRPPGEDSAAACYRVGFWSATDPDPAGLRFRQACREASRDPSAAAAFGWDAVMRIRRGLANGGLTRVELALELAGGPVVGGATGRLGAEPGRGSVENPAVSSWTAAGEVFICRVEIREARAP